ncbi:hypothetical protein DL766_003841 [Monosporascus sp. MC13-8B]|uniref:1,3-beta-glucanosyltransferase n=1 Tax=Monosporascus cannonballus TaxID=155416 RepID=A0ABY0H288_9PEZI|nr:hypothetical protein DL762_007921 [Monosporascus cannonballus]RYO90610.1 hypothetical protein DL763_005285 [Monosporascus cannonballus]RYP32753.1 hypothetical protein DL766_003841 [Monosporascus sp. MC13-8B]
MWGRLRTATSRALACCLVFLVPCLTLVEAISPISVKGTKLYDDEGNQFFIKGVTYAFSYIVDPLLDTSQCQIDAGLIKDLGANTIRVYTVDGSQNHDGCMQAFRSQGIYVWVDLPSPSMFINRIYPEWTMQMFYNWSATIDAFAGYDNTLAFTVGNEAIVDTDTSVVAPYVKAAVRDLKAFREKRGYRAIPLAYTANDSVFVRKVTAEYFACGDPSEAIELFGVNLYSWCGQSDYYKSKFNELYEEFQEMNIPLAFSGTVCNSEERKFSEVAAMLGPVFQAVFSGSVVYTWAQEDNAYGIVKYPDSRRVGFPTTLRDYNALSTVFASVNPSGTPRAEYTPSNTAPACPTSANSEWLVAGDVSGPTISDLDIDTVTARTTIISKMDDATGITVGTGPNGEPLVTGASSLDDSRGKFELAAHAITTGAIVGIVVSCVGAVVFAALAAFIILRKQRRARQQQQQQEGGQEGVNAGFTGPYGGGNGSAGAAEDFKPELPADSVGYVMPRQELPAEHTATAYQGYGPPGPYSPYSDGQHVTPMEMGGSPVPPQQLPGGNR